MSNLEATNDVLNNLGQQPISADEFNAIRKSIEPEAYRNLIEHASRENPNAVSRLTGWVTVARLDTRINKAAGPAGSIEELRDILRHRGQADVTALIEKLENGDAEAYDELEALFDAAGKRIHDASAAPAKPNNVSQFPPRGQATRTEANEHAAPSQPSGDEDEGDWEPPQSARRQPEARQESAAPARQGHGGQGQSAGNRQERQLQRSNYDEAKAFGRDGAFKIERSLTQDDRAYTLNLTMAKPFPGKRVLDGLDWANAIIVSCVPSEIFLITAAFYGLAPKVRFAGHGRNNDKWFEIEENTDPEWQGNIRITIAQGTGDRRDIRKVNVTKADVAQVLGVCLRTCWQALNTQPGMSIDPHPTIRRAADLYRKEMAAKELKSNGQQRGGGQGGWQGGGQYANGRR